MVRDGMVRRASWGIGDQALSSLTNFLLAITVARLLGPEAFGAFSLAFAVYLFALNAARALISEPLVVVYSGVQEDEWRSASRAATGNAVVFGVACGLVSAVVGMWLGGLAGTPLVLMGMLLPGLLLQDLWRSVFFSAGKPERAFVNDLVWALALLPSAGSVIWAGSSNPWSFVLAWGLSGTIAGVFGVMQSGLMPRPQLLWWKQHRGLSSRFLIEFLARNGAWQASFYSVTAYVGLSGVGALRGAQILFGPLNILYNGVHLIAVPEGVRLARESLRKLWRLCLAIAVVLAVAPILWTTALLGAPAGLGRALLGETWGGASQILVPIGLGMAGRGASTAAVIGLRSVADASRSLRARLIVSLATILAVVQFAAMDGIRGAVWALAVTSWVGAGLFWFGLVRGLRARAKSGAARREF